MKNLIRSLIFAAIAVCLPVAVHANVWKSTSVSTTAVTICVPSPQCHVVIIQNNGSGAVRLSIDGGTSYVDPVSGKSGNSPTATYGYLLQPGQQLTLSMPPQGAGPGNPDSGLHRPIVAIMATGASSTTLDIVTDDYFSTFPTS
jgi:hypothetical protein